MEMINAPWNGFDTNPPQSSSALAHESYIPDTWHKWGATPYSRPAGNYTSIPKPVDIYGKRN